MSKIRSQNTGLEKLFLRLLRKSTKLKFEVNVRSIRGTPDVVFEREKICIFLDGDFWHGWQFPRWKHQMKNKFWREKIEKNRKRDLKTNRYLRSKGWKVIRLWEHQVKSQPVNEITNFVPGLPEKITGHSKAGGGKIIGRV
jgi:DNA mismatch endonuclease, patch repair protein